MCVAVIYVLINHSEDNISLKLNKGQHRSATYNQMEKQMQMDYHDDNIVHKKKRKVAIPTWK